MLNVNEMVPGQAYTWAGQAVRLGQEVERNGVQYVVCQGAAAYTAGIAGAAFTTARDSVGKPTWVVSKATVANSPDVAGFGPASGTESFADEAYFLLQRSGVLVDAVAGATACDGRHLTTDTALGVKTVLSATEIPVGANVVAKAVDDSAAGVANIELYPAALVPTNV